MSRDGLRHERCHGVPLPRVLEEAPKLQEVRALQFVARPHFALILSRRIAFFPLHLPGQGLTVRIAEVVADVAFDGCTTQGQRYGVYMLDSLRSPIDGDGDVHLLTDREPGGVGCRDVQGHGVAVQRGDGHACAVKRARDVLVLAGHDEGQAIAVGIGEVLREFVDLGSPYNKRGVAQGFDGVRGTVRMGDNDLHCERQRPLVLVVDPDAERRSALFDPANGDNW